MNLLDSTQRQTCGWDVVSHCKQMFAMKKVCLKKTSCSHSPGLFLSLKHSFVVSKEKKSLSEVFGTMGQVYWTEKDIRVSAQFSYRIKELNSA